MSAKENLKEALRHCENALKLCPQNERAQSLRRQILSKIEKGRERQQDLKEKRDNFWAFIGNIGFLILLSSMILLLVAGVLTGLYFLGRWLQSIMPFSSGPTSNSQSPSILPPTQPPQISSPSPDVDFSFIAWCLDHGFIFGILAGIMLTVMFFLFGERYFKVVGIPCVVAGMGIALVLSYVFPGFVPYWNGTGFILSFIFTLLATILPMFFRRN